MGTLTMKFGGTSVGSVEAIEQAAGIVLSRRPATLRSVSRPWRPRVPRPFLGSSQICVPQGRHQGEYRCL